MKLKVDVAKHQIYGLVPFKLTELIKEDINNLIIFAR